MLLHPASSQQPAPPAKKGRAAGYNTPNRFAALHLEPDPLELDDEDYKERVPTQFLLDSSKSILAENDSPDVGFRFSLNPYRGCEHGCVYCASGATPILLANGRTRPLAELGEGDWIYGTHRLGTQRHYTKTQVLAHWEVEKTAYRITLGDGTQLTAAGDHRFLTSAGWKFVTGTAQGTYRRPHLTPSDSLLGTGGFTRTPTSKAPDYGRGYLCGLIRCKSIRCRLIRADALLSLHPDTGFRLTLDDIEALDRAAELLRDRRVETYRSPRAIGTHAATSVAEIRRIIAWPDSASLAWSYGFLAGVFDAQGSYSEHVLQISSSDADIMAQTLRALARAGFCAVAEATNARHPSPSSLRITGGLQQHLRFFHTTVPAISRKQAIDGQVVRPSSRTGVLAIEPIGSMTLFDITTGTGDFIADGVVSHNCYARPTHEYLGFSAGLDFETRILVKENAPDLLRDTFRKKSWEPQIVALSGNTDCYQPVERRLELTRKCLQVFLEFRNPVTIITKNALITRDLDILQQLAALHLVHVTMSITSLKRPLTAMMEPRTSRPEQRLAAIATLHEAGIPAGVNVAPLIPGLNDEEVPNILEASAARGAQWANYIMVRLPGSVKPLFIDWLQRNMPDRAGKIIRRIEAVRDGELSDPRFGSRMRGEGQLAEVVASFFHLSRRRYRLENRHDELALHHFRRTGHHQLNLFDP